MTPRSRVAFVLAQTRPRPVPFVPGLRLHLADEATSVWAATEAAVRRGEQPPPFWAFAWAGGQALARHLLAAPERVRGRDVVDLCSGSGLVAVAAARAGAASVTAYDVDEFAVTAIRLNARLNRVTVDARHADVAAVVAGPATLVTVGDAFYERTLAGSVLDALHRFADAGAEVLVGDPRRAYLPADELQTVAEYDVDVDPDLEDAPVKRTIVARLRTRRAAGHCR